MASELKPCPFCGGAAEMDTLRPYRNFTTGAVEDACAIYCLECSAEQSFCYRDAPGVDRDGVIADVEARWNTRSESLTAMEERVERVVEAAKKVVGQWESDGPTDEAIRELSAALSQGDAT